MAVDENIKYNHQEMIRQTIISWTMISNNQSICRTSEAKELKITSTHMCGGSLTTSSIISASSCSVNNSLISQPVLSKIRAITFFRWAAVAGILRVHVRMNEEMQLVAYPSAILMVGIN